MTAFTAPFGFSGELLPYCEEQTTEGLHHHGDEPERPGYTLQELMQLSRSSMLQQRITAISTLSNIFVKVQFALTSRNLEKIQPESRKCKRKPLFPKQQTFLGVPSLKYGSDIVFS